MITVEVLDPEGQKPQVSMMQSSSLHSGLAATVSLY